jgi:hypothetical protein
VHGDARCGKDNFQDNYKLHAGAYAVDGKDSRRVFEVDQGLNRAVLCGYNELDDRIWYD